MRCPYCVSEIDDQALACPRCAHDLYLFRPLLEKLAQLEKAGAEQAKVVATQAKAAAADAETRIAALEQDLAAIKAERAAAIPAAAAVRPSHPASFRSAYGGALLQALVPVLALLVVAHGVLLFIYDVKPLYLRIATVLIPMPFGVLLGLRYQGRLFPSAGAGFVMAVLAVLGMLSITATIDKVPVLPQDARDWRETLEYLASIGLAFLAGVLAGEFRAAFKLKVKPNRIAVLVAKAVTPNEEGEFGLERAAKRIDRLVKTATPIATAAGAIYVGIKAFLSNLG